MDGWKEPPIPGETPIDPSGLKIQGVATRAQLNIVEAQSIRPAFVKYLAAKPNRRTAPFDMAWCEKLHGEMFGDVWEWAGKIRNRNFNLGLPFHAIRDNFAGLLADLHNWSSYGMPLVDQAARLHYRAVLIHPFENGNGRWSRMLANIWLKRNSHAIIAWPEQVIGMESEIRTEYIDAIKQADDGDFNPLLEIHRRHLEQPESPT